MKKMLIVAATAIAAATSAFAQDYPVAGKTITTVVPSTAGGGTDTAARLIAPLLEKELGTTVEVVNKPGASMQIGNMEVARAKPDGYTLVWTVLPTAASIYLDSERDAGGYSRDSLTPIAMYYSTPIGVVVKGDSPYKTLDDLIQAAKTASSPLKSGTTGIMGVGHFANTAFQQITDTKMAVVTFQGGGPQLTALLGGHIDVGFNALGELVPYHKDGSVRVLGVLDSARSTLLPDVPTVSEAGYETITIASQIGLSAPAGTPQAIIDKLQAAMAAATSNPELGAKMNELGNSIDYRDAAGFTAVWNDVDAKYKPLIDASRENAK